MAFAYLSEFSAETGGIGHFDAQSPSTFAHAYYYHYSDLAAFPGAPAPYRGAYCFGIDLTRNSSFGESYLQETGSWDTTSGTAIYFRMKVWFGGHASTLTMSSATSFSFMQLWSGTALPEVNLGIHLSLIHI